MRLLALDTATEACSVAVLTDAGVIGCRRELGRGHAEAILPMIDAILAEAGITLGALDGIVAGIGPGAFTGVRISVSVAQGLAFGAGLPVVAVSSLEALAMQALHAGVLDVLVCLDARMDEVYSAAFTADPQHGLTARSAASVGAAAALHVPFTGAFHGIGRGFAAHAELAKLEGLVLTEAAAAALPDAADMAALGALRFRAGRAFDAADLTPLYLRDQVALTEAERAAVAARSAQVTIK